MPSLSAITVAWRPYVYAFALALVAFGTIRFQTTYNPAWNFDGYTYAIMAQMDRGVPYVTARAKARAFYAREPATADPTRRHYLEAQYPQYWRLFAPRIVYPWVASRLWPALGMQSLLVVSNVAFVAGLLLLYALLLRFAVPGIALALSLSCCALPTVRVYGSGATTDMLAFAFLVATLYAVVRYVATENAWWLAAYVVALALTSLTRPIPYILLFGAASLAIAGWCTGNRRYVRLGTIVALPALALCAAVVAIGAWAHSPSLVAVIAQLRTSTRYLPDAPLWQWYAARVAAVAAHAVIAVFALFAAPLGLAMLWLRRDRADVLVFIGIVVATVATIIVDPIVGDIERVIIFPLLPVFCCGLALGAEFVLKRASSHDAP